MAMCVAPSMCPAAHSASSRTSSTTASAGTSAADTVGTWRGITEAMVPRMPGGHRPCADPAPLALPGWSAMSPPPPAPVRDPAWSLSRSAIGLWRAQGVLGTVGYGLAVVLFIVFVPGDASWLVSLVRWAGPLFVVVYGVVAIAVRPRLRYRVHRWEVTADAVYTLTGWLSRTWTLVPVSRIQTVDVTRGVVQQVFGLASVAVLTASSQGTVRIPHLEAEVARRVAEDLARRAETVRDEAT